MPFFTSDIIQATTILDMDTTGEEAYVASGVLLISTLATTILGSNADETVTVYGEISSIYNTIRLTGDDSRVVIGTTGIVSSLATSDKATINLQGDNAVVVNAGLISGAVGTFMIGQSGTVNNSGTIQSYGSNFYIQNAGVFMVDTVNDETNAEYVINNFGEISGVERSIYAGEHKFNLYFASDTTVNNFGVLNGSVELGLGFDTLINAGITNGDVFLGGDEDLFDGRGGRVNGEVYGGDGDDAYFVDHTNDTLTEALNEGTDTVVSSVSFTLDDNFENLILSGAGNISGNGNELANLIEGNGGNNTLRASSGNDTVLGGNGNDRLFGQAGDDFLNGEQGDDMLRGGNGVDTLRGGDGNDVLIGNKHDDRLVGGGGDDILIGGKGKDTLIGDDGADTFVFARTNHSTNDANADKISDFEIGTDRIDLSDIIAGELVFIDGNAFSGTANEVRISTTGSGNSLVRVDTNGDGVADMKIVVATVTGLTVDDFIL